jgi:hypothetical protein
MVLGHLAKFSPIKTARFGLPDHIIYSLTWLDNENGSRAPSFVKTVQFLPIRSVRNINPPNRIKSSDPLLWEWTQSWQPRRRYVATLEKTRVAGNAVIGPDHAILWPLSPLWNVSPDYHPLLRCPILPKETRLPGRSLYLCVDSADNYFHWLLDLMQKFKVLRDAGIDYLNFDHYVVNSQAKEFQRESLRRLGIPSHKIVETNKLRNLMTEILTVPSWAEQSGIFEPEDVEWLRNKLMQAECYSQELLPDRFFISRKRTRGRNILNSKEFYCLLKKYNIVSIELESLSFSQQIRLFRDAKLVIGAHGAGLTNILFCQPKTKVIEFINEDYAFGMYYYMATVICLDYNYLIGVKNDYERSKEAVFQDMIIDIDLIDRTLELWNALTE